MVVKPYLNPKGDLPAFFLDSSHEQTIESAVEHSENMSHLNLAPQKIREILDAVQRTIGAPELPVVLLTTSGSRFFLRQIIETSVRNLFVVSHSEVPPGVKVMSLGNVR